MSESSFPPADAAAFLELCAGEWMSLRSGFELSCDGDDDWHSSERGTVTVRFDAAGEDALGRLDLSREGMRYRNKKVFDYVLERQVPCVVFMGGGYSDPIDHTVDALMDLFRGAANASLLFS